MEDLPIIPFGKYKDKPITAFLADKSYVEWCKKQEFFKKYTVIYNIVVNQSLDANDQRTPEHNKIQNYFLDEDNCRKLLLTKFKPTDLELYTEHFGKKIFGVEHFDVKIEFEGKFNWDIILKFDKKSQCSEVSIVKDLTISEAKKIVFILFPEGFVWSCDDFKYCDKYECEDKFEFKCECGGPANKSATTLNFRIFPREIDLYIEIKPLLGDDYPTVLRKMANQITLTRAQRKSNYQRQDNVSFILLIKEFKAESTTVEQLRKIFAQKGISVVFMNEVEKA